MRRRSTVSTCLAATALAAAAWAQAPAALLNARLEARSGRGDLAAALRRAAGEGGSLWAAWSVPMVAGQGDACCFGGARRRGCTLEGRSRGLSITDDEVPRPVDRRLVIYARFDAGAGRELRAYSDDCPVDAGGARVVWLDGVAPAASVDWLRARAVAEQRGGPGDEAMVAMALHADPRADEVLRELAAPSSPFAVREDAIFWLGQSRGRPGFAELARLAAAERRPEVLEKVAFSLSQCPLPEAGATLEGLALRHARPEVRAEAIFWLGQRGDAGAAAKLERAAAEDADLEVRKKAVFALAQLEDGGGTDALLRLVRRGREPQIRREALFWLGQSDDPRALESLEALLLR